MGLRLDAELGHQFVQFPCCVRAGCEVGIEGLDCGRRDAEVAGEHVGGVYRQRLRLASGRFAMLDDGLGFQLVPWSPSLEKRLGQQVGGVALPGGGVEWSFGRQRGLSL